MNRRNRRGGHDSELQARFPNADDAHRARGGGRRFLAALYPEALPAVIRKSIESLDAELTKALAGHTVSDEVAERLRWHLGELRELLDDIEPLDRR